MLGFTPGTTNHELCHCTDDVTRMLGLKVFTLNRSGLNLSNRQHDSMANNIPRALKDEPIM
jgi:hypothetical protein